MIGSRNPSGRITTQEQAIASVVGLVAETRRARDLCDVRIPDDPETTAKAQVEHYQRWLMLYGQAIGTLVAYYQCGLIQDAAYLPLKRQVLETLAPRVVGAITPVSHGLHLG